MAQDHLQTALELVLKTSEDTRRFVLEILDRDGKARELLVEKLIDLHKQDHQSDKR